MRPGQHVSCPETTPGLMLRRALIDSVALDRTCPNGLSGRRQSRRIRPCAGAIARRVRTPPLSRSHAPRLAVAVRSRRAATIELVRIRQEHGSSHHIPAHVEGHCFQRRPRSSTVVVPDVAGRHPCDHRRHHSQRTRACLGSPPRGAPHRPMACRRRGRIRTAQVAQVRAHDLTPCSERPLATTDRRCLSDLGRRSRVWCEHGTRPLSPLPRRASCSSSRNGPRSSRCPCAQIRQHTNTRS